MFRRGFVFSMVFLIAFGIDRLTKWWALMTLADAPIHVFPGLNFVLSWNRGVSWSMFATHDNLGFWVLTSFIMLIITGFSIYTVRRALAGFSVTCELFVLGGAISNVVDRFTYGAVIDFIELYAGQYSWPIFNIADACIVLGVCVLLLRSMRSGNE
jgi:signal peptidase II